MLTEIPFRFDDVEHQYIPFDTGEPVPHITGMLWQTGKIDDQWFTEESCERGTHIHTLTARYDHGALDLEHCVSKYINYLKAHEYCINLVRPRFLEIEQPRIHPSYRFGGRPDRVGIVYGLKSVWEVKSGAFEKAHLIQTALQAILASESLGIPAEMVGRFAEYVRPNGRGKVEQFIDKADFREAYRVIEMCCR